MSFAQAANELSVTPAALSYQIKSLEADLGSPLFHRLNRAVELTEAGRILLRGLSTAFQDIRGAWNSAKRYVDPSRLTITAGPSFTAKWLAPRMFHFAEMHPDLELRFIATLKFVDFARDDVDIAIRFGFGEDPGLFSETLYEGFITPMMHPNVAARLNQPADLLHETLIHDDSLSFLPNPPNWDRWFEAVGVSHPLLKGPRFSQADHAVDLALEGNGVVMGRASITARHVRAGQLVAPFRIALTAPVQYRIVCPAGTENRPAVALFRNWAREEIEKDRSLGDGFEKIEIDQVR